MYQINKNKQKGMLLVGTMFGLFIIGAVVTGGIYYYNNKRIEDRGKLAGEQIRILGQAVDEYISINRDKIAKLQSDSYLKCQSSGFCEITVDGLRATGELPNTFSDKNTWGSEYKIQIKRVGQAPDYQITGVVVTTQAPNKPKMLGFALKTGGANAGNNLIDLTKISGTSGLWSYTNQDYSIISNQQYQLAYRVGYNASQYSPYLRRDGSLNMTGDLQMAGHNIKDIDWLNANNIKVNGSAQVNNNLNIGGAATANFLQVNGDTSVGGKITGDLIPRQTVVAGQNCSPNGLIAKDETGALLSCVSGSWVSNSSSGNEMYVIRPELKFASSMLDDPIIEGFLYKQYIDHIKHKPDRLRQEISLVIGYNWEGDCLYSNLPNKQCMCGPDKKGIIINKLQEAFLVSCENINATNKYNVCNNVIKREKKNNPFGGHATIEGGPAPLTLKQQCKKDFNNMLSHQDGVIGFITKFYPKIEEKSKNSSVGGGGGATESGPGGSRK